MRLGIKGPTSNNNMSTIRQCRSTETLTLDCNNLGTGQRPQLHLSLFLTQAGNLPNSPFKMKMIVYMKTHKNVSME